MKIESGIVIYLDLVNSDLRIAKLKEKNKESCDVIIHKVDSKIGTDKAYDKRFFNKVK